jgi:protein-tyrosine-phosphatase
MHCESAGFFPVRGRCPPEAAIVAADSLGIDLGSHRSRVFTPELADRAEVIFIFDQQQRSELEGAYPECLPKVHYLGALDASGPLEVEDPYGGGIDACRAGYERIQRLLAIP